MGTRASERSKETGDLFRFGRLFLCLHSLLLVDGHLSTEHDELQNAWTTFLKDQELAVESKTVATRGADCQVAFEAEKEDNEPREELERTEDKSRTDRLHVFADVSTINKFREGYKLDKDFSRLVQRSALEGYDVQKYRAYRLSSEGLLYFEDADSRIRLCVPSSERLKIIKEVHDEAHETAHAGWE